MPGWRERPAGGNRPAAARPPGSGTPGPGAGWDRRPGLLDDGAAAIAAIGPVGADGERSCGEAGWGTQGTRTRTRPARPQHDEPKVSGRFHSRQPDHKAAGGGSGPAGRVAAPALKRFRNPPTAYNSARARSAVSERSTICTATTPPRVAGNGSASSSAEPQVACGCYRGRTHARARAPHRLSPGVLRPVRLRTPAISARPVCSGGGADSRETADPDPASRPPA
jgi:hypothetical protein